MDSQNTMGIWIPNMFSIRMVRANLIIKWFGFRMVYKIGTNSQDFGYFGWSEGGLLIIKPLITERLLARFLDSSGFWGC